MRFGAKLFALFVARETLKVLVRTHYAVYFENGDLLNNTYFHTRRGQDMSCFSALKEVNFFPRFI